MKYVELHLAKEAPIWDVPEEFVAFLKSCLDQHGPVLIVPDDETPGMIKVDTDGTKEE